MRASTIITVAAVIAASNAAAQSTNKAAYDWGVRLAQKRGVPDADCYGKIWERYGTRRSGGVWFVEGNPAIRAEMARCGDDFAWQPPRDAKSGLRGWNGIWGAPHMIMVGVRGSNVTYTFRGKEYPVSAVQMTESVLNFDFGDAGHITMTMHPNGTAHVDGRTGGGRPISFKRIYRGTAYN